ncbi:putative Dynein axonemal light chain 1 [Blattamonas nauphoetae]|uniref:Dynein axonemal light chain 1 n=1 Tax=Blattamonas nauphoetae TaxID=2049346 RepID=A0ABQ9YHL6_9EUKA|nr:putative Dynein axonemal light chain 1 [Blattamonas nauphoetae]
MSKPTTIAIAIKNWEEKNQKKAAEVEEIKLICQIPPIEKMDAGLQQLKHIRNLSLSTNRIDKIANLSGFEHLELLSLGRNLLKKIEGLDAVSGTLKTLWLSYNSIAQLSGVLCCKRLQCLYIAHNNISSWDEISKLGELPELSDVSFVGNPIQTSNPGQYKQMVLTKLPNVTKLDGALMAGDSADENPEQTPSPGPSPSGGA